MLPLRHKHWRYLFQSLWLLIIAALFLVEAGWQVWAGLLVGGLLSALLVKRAVCSCVCPVFPLGELLWRTGARLCGRNFVVPFWLDLALRSAKYLALGWVILTLSDYPMGAEFNSVPMGFFAFGAAALLVLSLFFQLPWCRYLCPYGALLGLVSVASLLTMRRSSRHCVRCHKCSNRCPANLPVMLRSSVRSPECLACYRCVDGCPAPGALAFATPGLRAVPAWLTGSLLTLFLLTVLGLTYLI